MHTFKTQQRIFLIAELTALFGDAKHVKVRLGLMKSIQIIGDIQPHFAILEVV